MYHKPDITLYLQSTLAEAHERADALAKQLQIDITHNEPSNALRLVMTDDRLELRGPREVSTRGVWVDFTQLRVQCGGGLTRRQPLARAIGRACVSVVDATAGMGQDAFRLACLGYDMTAVERSPTIAALLEDGLRRAMNDASLVKIMAGQLRLVHGDATHVLDTLSPQPDAVYIDPMFPPKRRASALPRKEIQLLRLVVGDDPDIEELFHAAMAAARRRVIIKRPTHAQPLAAPTMSYTGKLVRYDVYVVKRDPTE